MPYYTLYKNFVGLLQTFPPLIENDSGVGQGDSLSPKLFNIVLDFVLRRVELAGVIAESDRGIPYPPNSSA